MALNERLKSSVYLLPNTLTTAAIFCGFFSIISSSNGQFEKAIFAIILASIFDMLDGRVARLTQTESNFGEVYDSLSDMISFGVAPSMLAYFWILNDYNNIGSASVFIYLAGAAMRLARFTAKAGEQQNSPTHFEGLPSPAAAISAASFAWVMVEYKVTGVWVGSVYLFLMAFLGILMVSNVPYYSFKKLPFSKSLNFFTFSISSIIILALLLISPVISVLVVFWVYVILFFSYFIYKVLVNSTDNVLGNKISKIAKTNKNKKSEKESEKES